MKNGLWLLLTYVVMLPFIPLPQQMENKSCTYRSIPHRTPIQPGMTNTMRMALDRRDALTPRSKELVGCDKHSGAKLVMIRLNPINRFKSLWN